MGAGSGRSVGFNPGPTIGGLYQKWERRHNEQAMVRGLKERPFYGRAQRSEMFGSNAVDARRAKQDRLRGRPSFVPRGRKFPTAGRSSTSSFGRRRFGATRSRFARAGGRKSYGRGFSRFRRRFSRKRVAFTSALRHILCRPNQFHDTETWVQGWTDANSAHQSWFALNVMHPRIISQMYQGATRTQINLNTYTSLAIEWYMKSFRAQITLANQCFSRTRCSVFVCYPRRDIATTVYDSVDGKVASEIVCTGPIRLADPVNGQTSQTNCLNTLGDYSAVTSSLEPTSSTARDRLWMPGASPFMSPIFCRMFKVTKVKHYSFAPGEEMKINMRIKPRVMSMGRYVSYAGTAINGGNNQYDMAAYYQCVKGFPVLYIRAYGQVMNNTSVDLTGIGEFTSQIPQAFSAGPPVVPKVAGSDVGQQQHQISGKIMRHVEFYAPFQTNTRATWMTSLSHQAGPGIGLTDNTGVADAKMVYPTLSANQATIL